MKLLLHTCCGPCSIFPLSLLRAEGHRVTACYANPNIHPYREWEKRLITLRAYLAHQGVDLEVDDRYDLREYLSAVLPVADDPARRCRTCYRLRLDEVARRAAAGGYDAFSTTLLVSPYQQHEAVAEAGRQAGQAHGVPFHYRDFRPGWKEAVRVSRQLGMYRQGYCGCLFSERERYYRPQGAGHHPCGPADHPHGPGHHPQGAGDGPQGAGHHPHNPGDPGGGKGV